MTGLILPAQNFIKHCGIVPHGSSREYGALILDFQEAHKKARRLPLSECREQRWIASTEMQVKGKTRQFYWLECKGRQIMSSFFHFFRGVYDHALGPALWVSRYFNGEGMVLIKNGEMRNVRFASRIRGGMDRRQAEHHIPRCGVTQ